MGQAFRQCLLDPNNNYAAAIKFNLMFAFSDTDRETLKNYFITAMVNKEPDIVAYFIIFYFHEPFPREEKIGFAFIWVALLLYSVDQIFRLARGKSQLLQ